jgi:hypothetical protein
MFTIQTSTPSANITTKKSRLKEYGNKVYLNDGTQFEIELFNPKDKPVLAKIKLNGSYISSSGLILKPGQRVFLERFIDVDKKFKFETYEVEASQQVADAIRNNGLVEVEFYDEQVYSQQPFWYGGNTVTLGNSGTWNSNPTFTTSGSNAYYSSTSGIGLVNCSSSITSGTVDMSAPKEATKETGRVEQGEKSKQEMETGYGNFNSWTSSSIKWQIMPTSTKPVEVSEIRNYCPGCRTRIKKSSWKFCPSCGENLKD